jgi:uncharacterized protein (UPF0332 family)
MKEVAAEYLAQAERSLSKACVVMGVSLFDEAGRLAYYAMFHAAQALIFERTDKVAKTHRGVSKQFHKLASNEAGLDAELAAGLSNAYRLKEIADYETGAAALVTSEVAADAISEAAMFVARVKVSLRSAGTAAP